MNDRIEQLEDDLKFNREQYRLISRDMGEIARRIDRINAELVKEINFSEFDVD